MLWKEPKTVAGLSWELNYSRVHLISSSYAMLVQTVCAWKSSYSLLKPPVRWWGSGHGNLRCKLQVQALL